MASARSWPSLDTHRVEIGQTDVVAELTKVARQVHDAADLLGHDVLTGRVTGRGGDAWMPTVAFVTDVDPDDLSRLESELDTHPAAPPSRS